MSAASAENLATTTFAPLGDNSAASVADDRRTEVRRPVNFGFHIVPLDRRGRPLYDAAFTATGKNISKHGLCVAHLAPMEYPRAVITAMGASSAQFRLEAEVAWTGPTASATYETGFKITRKIL
jgi:hypothetical protein